MEGEKELAKLLLDVAPLLNEGVYVFCVVPSLNGIPHNEVLGTFREAEGHTLIMKKNTADQLGLPYSFEGTWITLRVHSSLSAAGLTAAFSTALAAEGIGCNVVAAFYHDHIFVQTSLAAKAMRVLQRLSRGE